MCGQWILSTCQGQTNTFQQLENSQEIGKEHYLRKRLIISFKWTLSIISWVTHINILESISRSHFLISSCSCSRHFVIINLNRAVVGTSHFRLVKNRWHRSHSSSICVCRLIIFVVNVLIPSTLTYDKVTCHCSFPFGGFTSFVADVRVSALRFT